MTMQTHFSSLPRRLANLALIAIGLALGAPSHAQSTASAPASSASAAKPARHFLKRKPMTANVPKSNNPTSPRNTGIGATGDGSGADTAGPPIVRPARKAASGAN